MQCSLDRLSYEGLKPFCANELQRERLDAYFELQSMQKAGERLGVSQSAIKQTINGIKSKAASKGFSPEADAAGQAPPGYVVKGKSTLHDETGAAPDSLEESTADDSPRAVYEFEPDEQEILQVLLPRNLAVQIFHSLLENAASEHGARMTAMDNATRNAGEMIDGLTLTYNRTRQAFITKELIEIISGAEAL